MADSMKIIGRPDPQPEEGNVCIVIVRVIERGIEDTVRISVAPENAHNHTLIVMLAQKKFNSDYPVSTPVPTPTEEPLN